MLSFSVLILLEVGTWGGVLLLPLGLRQAEAIGGARQNLEGFFPLRLWDKAAFETKKMFRRGPNRTDTLVCLQMTDTKVGSSWTLEPPRQEAHLGFPTLD